MLFVCAMITMGLGAMVVGLARELNTWTGGLTVIYYVITATTTVRRKNESAPLFDAALMVIPIAVGLTTASWGVKALSSPGWQLDGIPAPMMFLSATLLLLAATGDARVLLYGPLAGSRRLARHLWRMCWAAFSATGSFFLDQAKVIPQALRIWPVLIILAVVPLVMLFYWLWRVRRRPPVLVVNEPQPRVVGDYEPVRATAIRM